MRNEKKIPNVNLQKELFLWQNICVGLPRILHSEVWNLSKYRILIQTVNFMFFCFKNWQCKIILIIIIDTIIIVTMIIILILKMLT